MKIKNIFILSFKIIITIIIISLYIFGLFKLPKLNEYFLNTKIETSYILYIITFITTIIIYVKSRTIKQSVYTLISYTIINQKICEFLPNFQISYRKSKVNNLIVCLIAFWNNGNKTIDKTDIPDGDPLRINIPDDVKVLEKSIIISNNQANRFSIDDDYNKSIKIDFDYLDPNEGAMIKLIHNGSTSKDIFVKGKIKGASEPNYIDLNEGNLNLTIDFSSFKFSLKIRRNFIGFVFIFLSLSFILISLFSIIYLKQSSIALWFNVFFYSYAIYYSYQKYLKIKIPKEFNFVVENIF